MGSTTNDASTKKVSFADKATATLQSSCAVEQGHDGQPSAQPIIQGKKKKKKKLKWLITTS